MQTKKVSTFVIHVTIISYFEQKCSIQLEYIIHHYCQLWIKLIFSKLLKRDSACNRLSKNRINVHAFTRPSRKLQCRSEQYTI